jgi:hypothetical protein
MRRDLLGNLQTAAIPEVRGNSRRPEGVVSDFRMDAGSLCPPADHPVGIRLPHWPACERIGFTDRCAELGERQKVGGRATYSAVVSEIQVATTNAGT